jgi:hypothetical protein
MVVVPLGPPNTTLAGAGRRFVAVPVYRASQSQLGTANGFLELTNFFGLKIKLVSTKLSNKPKLTR